MTASPERVLTRAWIVCTVLAFAGAGLFWYRTNAANALSFFLGAVVAIVNLRWLEYSVSQIMDAFEVTGAQARAAAETEPKAGKDGAAEAVQEEEVLVKKRPRSWPKLVLRYAFLGAIAYVILRSRFVSIGPFLAGLFLPILALMLEGAYEAYAAFRA